MNVARTTMTAALPQRLRAYHFLIALWALTMISIPIIRWVVGDAVLHWGVIAGVLLQVVAVPVSYTHLTLPTSDLV